jgi:hypothetical protein
MLNMDENGFKFMAQLRAELEWLRENHPDKRALICVAESSVRVVDQAGSTTATALATGVLERASIPRVSPN